MGCIRNEILEKRKMGSAKTRTRIVLGKPFTTELAEVSRKSQKSFLAIFVLSQRSLRFNALRFGPRSLRRERFHLVEDVHRLQDHSATDFQALAAEFINRVLNRVVENIVVSVVDVDDVGTGDADLHER
jgi:hypothetical protein